MPTVPRYESRVTSGVSQARQNIRVSADAFGAAEARALGDAAQGISAVAEYAERRQAEDDETSAREAYVAASDALRDRMRGEKGFLTTQGRNAEEQYEQFIRDVDSIPTKLAANLSPQAREQFDAMWQSRSEGALNSGATHVFNERASYQEQVRSAELQERANAAIESSGNAGAVYAEVGEGTRLVREQALASGADPEVADAAAAEWRSNQLLVSISAALDTGDVPAAEAIYSWNDGEFLVGADRAQARGLIDTANRQAREQALAQDVFSRFGTDERAGRAYIRENYEGAEEDNLLTRYGRRVGEATVSAADRQAQVFDQASEMFEENPYLLVSDLPIPMQNALTAGQIDMLNSRRRGIPEGEQRDYINEIARQGQEDPAALRSRNPEDFARHLTGERLQQARRIWNDAWEETGNTADEIDLIRSETSIINSGLDVLGIDRSNTAQRRVFDDAVEAGRRAFAAENDGREPNRRELQEIVDAATADTLINPGFAFAFGLGRKEDNVPLARSELTGDYAFVERAFPAEMSEARRDQVYTDALAGFHARGVTPTPEELTFVIRRLSGE